MNKDQLKTSLKSIENSATLIGYIDGINEAERIIANKIKTLDADLTIGNITKIESQKIKTYLLQLQIDMVKLTDLKINGTN